MSNNIYLIDFLKYILIRDPSHRPSIQNIINRFENLYSLLVNNEHKVTEASSHVHNSQSTEILLKEYMELVTESKKTIKLKT